MGFHVPSRIDSASFPPSPRFSPGTEDSGEGFRGTGQGPFRTLIISSFKGGGVYDATTTRSHLDYFVQYMEAISGCDKSGSALNKRDNQRGKSPKGRRLSSRRPPALGAEERI